MRVSHLALLCCTPNASATRGYEYPRPRNRARETLLDGMQSGVRVSAYVDATLPKSAEFVEMSKKAKWIRVEGPDTCVGRGPASALAPTRDPPLPETILPAN